jgi:hypothetical protein
MISKVVITNTTDSYENIPNFPQFEIPTRKLCQILMFEVMTKLL